MDPMLVCNRSRTICFAGRSVPNIRCRSSLIPRQDLGTSWINCLGERCDLVQVITNNTIMTTIDLRVLSQSASVSSYYEDGNGEEQIASGLER